MHYTGMAASISTFCPQVMRDLFHLWHAVRHGTEAHTNILRSDIGFRRASNYRQ